MEQRDQGSQPHSPLSHLPNELFELVLQHANFESIAALRSTCKANANRCMSPAFKAYYAHQTIDLSADSLTRITHIASHPQLAPAVTHITVVAVCYDPSIWERLLMSGTMEPDDEYTECVSLNKDILCLSRRLWLGQSAETTAISLAAIFDRLPFLRTLRLNARIEQAARGRCGHNVDVCASTCDPFLGKWVGDRVREAVVRGDMDWISLWEDCSRVLDMVTQAMARSHANIKCLSVFDGCFGKVGSDKFDPTFLPVLQPNTTLNKNFAAAAAKLTTLNLAFSTRTHTPVEIWIGPAGHRRFESRPTPQLFREFHLPRNLKFDDIANFLKATPNLEALSLYMYNTLKGHPVVYGEVIDHIADEVRLPNLRRLRLQGIWCDPDGLLRLLRAHPNITELDLCELHLRGPMSSWERIFGFLKQRMHGLSKVYLENLCYARGQILPLTPRDRTLSSESDLSYPAKNREQEPIVYARHIGQKELQNGIELAVTTLSEPLSTRGRGGNVVISWLKKRHEDYGPPRCVLYQGVSNT